MTKDKTPMSPPDYDQSKVPEAIKRRADYVRTKFHGEDVLESLAQGMEYTGVMANEALEAQAYDGNSLADVTLAKDGLPTLDARIKRDVNNLENKKADKAEVTAQLAQTDQKINTKANQSEVTTIASQIDNLVANAGNTDGNAELLDIRVGADGTIYDTAGDAVRNVLSQYMTAQNEIWEVI